MITTPKLTLKMLINLFALEVTSLLWKTSVEIVSDQRNFEGKVSSFAAWFTVRDRSTDGLALLDTWTSASTVCAKWIIEALNTFIIKLICCSACIWVFSAFIILVIFLLKPWCCERFPSTCSVNLPGVIWWRHIDDSNCISYGNFYAWGLHCCHWHHLQRHQDVHWVLGDHWGIRDPRNGVASLSRAHRKATKSTVQWNWIYYGLVQDCSNSSALTMELMQSCTKLDMAIPIWTPLGPNSKHKLDTQYLTCTG